MRGRSVLSLSVLALTGVLVISASASAQQTSSIAGVARDASGAVIPGVTVEAGSTALIERVRTAVTDEQGRYNIVDLRPGTYTVTFTLPGFTTFRRDGITLTAGFTATINGELQVGGLAETVTVTGEASLVDTTNVRQQMLLSSDLLEALPTGTKSQNTLVALTAGFSGISDVAGVYSTQVGGTLATFHGKSGTKVQFDGMSVQHSSGNTGYMINAATVQEMTMQTSGISAESTADGAVVNMIPREGGNTFSGSIFGLYTNNRLQSNNLTQKLRDRGLTTTNSNLRIYDATATLGGPIKKDKLWFFTAHREWGNAHQVAGLYWNKTQGTPFYTPDLDRPADRYQWYESHAFRVTWQASQKNKFNFFSDFQDACICRSSSAIGTAPESAFAYHFRGLRAQGLHQVTWNAPITNRLLLEAGYSATRTSFPNDMAPGVTRDHVSITEQSIGLVYNARPSYNDRQDVPRYTQRFSISYVTGSHVIKAGFQNEQGRSSTTTRVNRDVNYAFNNGQPVQITQYATPYAQEARTNADLGIFAQDQWRIQRLTLNYGARFDYFNGSVPAQSIPAPPSGWVPARDFAPVTRVPEWTDLSPRLGAAYDLRGDGRTALKVSLGKYVAKTGTSIASANDPVQTSVNSVTRTWTDSNRNYVPDCDLANRALNLECGAMSNQSFGGLRVTTRYADDVLRGFNVRDHNWDFSTEVQHQLWPSVSVTGGYYRNWYGNFRVTDNLAISPEDFTPYCITAPRDAYLPGGGSYEVCGLYDISLSKFGQVNNLVTRASKFGKQTLVNDFFNVSLNARFPSGVLFFGGVDAGRTVSDTCFVVDSPQQLLNCHIVAPFKRQAQIKLNGSYPLRGGFVVSGVFQNLPGPAVDLGYAASNAEIAPSLKRNLAACGTRTPCNATARVPMTTPGTLYEGRTTRLDVRLTKIVRITERTRVQLNLDLYNALNASSILSLVSGGALNAGSGVNLPGVFYGPTWRKPTEILEGRILQFSSQLSF